MRDMSMMSPQEIATKYGGDKRKIGRAVQMGLLDPTAAVMAGMFIDRIRAAASQEQQPESTVADDMFAQQAMPYAREPVPSGGVAALPVPEDMVPNEYAGGGIVAFAGPEGSFVETPGGLNVLSSELEDEDKALTGEADELGRARRYVDLYRDLIKGVSRGPAYAEAKKFYEGAAERGAKSAERAKWGAGLAAASKLLTTRGNVGRAFGAAGEAAAPGLQKAAEMESTAQEAALKNRLALEDKERAEELEAIKSGMGMYGREQERRLTAESRSNQLKDYVKIHADAAQLAGDERPRAIIEAEHARDYINLLGAAAARGEAALGGVDVRGVQARTEIETAITRSNEQVNNEYKSKILQARISGKPQKEVDAEIARLEQEREAVKERRAAEIRGGRSPAASSAPAASRAPTSSGLPPGAKQIGTSGGKPVFQLPDGSQVIQQ